MEMSLGKIQFDRKDVICNARGRTNFVFKGTYDGQVCAVKRVMIVLGETVGVQTDMRDIKALRDLSSTATESEIPLMKYFGVEQNEDFRFIACELFDGDLKQYVLGEKTWRQSFACGSNFQNRPPLTFEVKMKLAKQASEGVRFVHQKNWVHKDIKPSNFLIHWKEDQPQDILCKLGDFGFAKKMMEDQSAASNSSNTGTVGYIAPEVSEKTPFNHRSDIWSLGCVLNFILTGGRHPFGEEDRLDHIIKGLRPMAEKKQLELFCEQRPQFSNLIEEMIQFESRNRPSMEQVCNVFFGKNQNH